MGAGERGGGAVVQRYGQGGFRAGVAQVYPALDRAIRGTLRQKLCPRGVRQLVGPGVQGGHRTWAEGQLDRLLAQHDLIRQAHAVCRQHAGQGVDEHRAHAQLVGHKAGMLAASAAKARKGEAGWVLALLDAHLLDRACHVADGDAQKSLRGGMAALAHLRRQRAELRANDVRIQRFVSAQTEQVWEMRRLQPAQHDVGVGHGKRPAAAITRRTRRRARAVRPHAHPCAVIVQDAAAAGCHGVDRHHRRTHPHAGDLGFERTLERAVVQRHICTGAAHIEADDPLVPGHRRRARRADDAARRARQDGVLALEPVRLRQAAVGLHKEQPRVAQRACNLVHILAQHGRQIGVHHRRIATRH